MPPPNLALMQSTKSKSPLLKLFFSCFLLLLFAGCGHSEANYVFSTNQAPANTGNLVFNFFQAQAVFEYEAPAGTNAVKFELFTGPNGSGTLNDIRTEDFQPQIVLNNVSSAVQSAVLTFYSPSGIPLLEVTVDAPVIANQSVTVDFSDATERVPVFTSLSATPKPLPTININGQTPINVLASFDNGDNVDLTGDTQVGLSYDLATPGFVTVSNAGVVTGQAEGNTDITVSLTANGTLKSDVVSATVTGVVDGLVLTRLEITANPTVITVDGTSDLTVNGFDQNDDPFTVTEADYTVTSGDEDIAEVDGLVVTGMDVGETTITVIANSDASITDTVEITVAEGFLVDFESFSLGTPAGQQGWRQSNSNYDTEIVNVASFRSEPAFAIFGEQALRMSNFFITGSFGDQLFTPDVAVPVGETRVRDTVAPLRDTTGLPRNTTFELEFDFGTTSADQQVGLAMSISPDNGAGGRMSYLLFEDLADGITVRFVDYPITPAPVLPAVAYVYTTVAEDLSREMPHHVRLVMTVVEGGPEPGDLAPQPNDIVEVYINGELIYTGTSWEAYYPQVPVPPYENRQPDITQTVLFRLSGTAVSANEDEGFLFDNIVLKSY